MIEREKEISRATAQFMEKDLLPPGICDCDPAVSGHTLLTLVGMTTSSRKMASCLYLSFKPGSKFSTESNTASITLSCW